MPPVAEGETAEAPPASASSEVSSTPPTGAAPESAPGNSTPPERTYTGDDLSRIVSARLNEGMSKFFQEFGVRDAAELRSTMQKYRDMEKTFAPKPAEDPEVKQFRDFMSKHYPQLDQMSAMAEHIQQANSRILDMYARAGHAEIDKALNERFGLTEEAHRGVIRGLVAQSLQADKGDFANWYQTGDPSVVQKHFDLVCKNMLDPMFRQASAKYATAKADQLGKTPPKLPAGGTPAPISKDGRLSSEERVSAAFKRMTEG